jgi:copper chaperone CopZ
MQTEILKVEGMNSEKSIDAVTGALAAITGVSEISVSLLRSEVTVQFDEAQAATPQLKGALAGAGYTASCASKSPEAGGGSCCGGCCH